MNQCLLALALAPMLFAANAGVAKTTADACAPAKHSKVPAIGGKTYHQARKLLMSSGWQPVQKHSYMEAKSDPDIAYGNGAVFWERGYVEVQECAGTGVAPCNFLFKDVYANRLQVGTVGEENPKERAYASVRGFSFVCE